MGFMDALGKVGKVLGRTLAVGKRIGSFVLQHHQHLAPLAHGLAMASGNETAQKVTGLGMAASKMVALRHNLDRTNAVARGERAGGGSGLFDVNAGRYAQQPGG